MADKLAQMWGQPVLIDNKGSAEHTLIEVNGRDRRGLLYRLTRALSDLKLQISSAKISTFGERAVDVFYVKNLFGHKVEHPAKLDEIRATLGAVLAKGNRAATAFPAPSRRDRVVVCNAPVVEGAVMAATEAASGATLEAVRRTAEELTPV